VAEQSRRAISQFHGYQNTQRSSEQLGDISGWPRAARGEDESAIRGKRHRPKEELTAFPINRTGWPTLVGWQPTGAWEGWLRRVPAHSGEASPWGGG